MLLGFDQWAHGVVMLRLAVPDDQVDSSVATGSPGGVSHRREIRRLADARKLNKRCANLRKRMSLTSGTALGRRCNVYASRTCGTGG